MTRLSRDVVRSGLAGAASGGRTFTGLALQAATARPDADDRLDATLAVPWVAGLIGVAAVGELAADKLPFAPSRLEPPGLAGRLVVGAVCGAVVARREPDTVLGPPGGTAFDPSALPDGADDRRARTIACALVGVTAALAASWAGTRWRSAASSWFGRDWIGAVLEDVTVVGLAAAAARPNS